MKKGMVLLFVVFALIVSGSFIVVEGSAIDAPLKAQAQTVQAGPGNLAAIRAIDAKGVTSLASRIHLDFRTLVANQKLPLKDAVAQQKRLLAGHPDVKEVTEMPGHNLFVRFKDNNELLMLLGQDRLGSASDGPVRMAQVSTQYQLKPQQAQPTLPAAVKQGVLGFAMPACSPTSNKALIFDCLADDYNVVNPPIWNQLKANLEAMGFVVTVAANNNANLANAALIDDGEYGMVFMRGHGGDLGNDFAFLARPWYPAYPPANSGYSGTIRVSAHNNATNTDMFGYAFTGTFAATYWKNKPFPGTIFFLESCHGTDPGSLPGMPTWTMNHGASAWIGWNESVTFNCGDKGTKLFIEKVGAGKTLGEAVSAVYATGCRPPELTLFPAGKAQTQCKLGAWYADPNEATVPDNQDFKFLRLLLEDQLLYATIGFYAPLNFDEFVIKVDTNGDGKPDVLVKCHPNTYEVYKETQPGVFNNKVQTNAPAKTGNTYMVAIPWATLGTAGGIKVSLVGPGNKDLLPDSGWIAVGSPGIN